MTDVVKIAKKHIDALDTQIAKLEEFIRMAEALLKHSLAEPNKASAPDVEKPAEPTGSANANPTNANPNATASDGPDADAEREDVSVRKLNAGERVHEPGADQNEPAPQRRFPSFGRLHP